MLLVFNDVCTVVTWLISSIPNLKEGINSFYEYMCVLTSYEINPLIIPPSDLRNAQLDMKNEIQSNSRPALPDKPYVHIWSYFSIMHMSSIIREDFLIVILSMPLTDKSLQMDL